MSKEEIELIMKNNEKELAPILAKMGRTILPDAIYGGHFSVRKGDLDQHGEIIRSLPDKDVALANMTIDLYALNDKGNWIIIQRRIYDDNGVAIQDFDYTHQDTKGTHLFPHIHVWINGKRIGLILKYRKK